MTYIESNPNRRERNIDICYTNKILSFGINRDDFYICICQINFKLFLTLT